MTPSLKHVSADALPADLHGHIARDGAVVVDGILSAAQLDAINADFDRIADTLSPGLRNATGKAAEEFNGSRTVRFDGLPAKSDTFTDVMLLPQLTGAADHFLLPHCLDYLLNTGQLIEIHPGEDAQRLHRDEDAWRYGPLDATGPRAQLQVEALFALSDFTSDNGATRVVPGSHLWPHDRDAGDGDILQAEMAAGSALVYLGSTLHGGGANRTAAEKRRGMFVGYVSGWLRTEENMFLTVPLDLAKRLPRRAQELLGYKAHRGIGVVDVGDPMVMLEQG